MCARPVAVFGPVDGARAAGQGGARPDRRAAVRSVHERIWNSPGPRWFTETDAIWRVHADTSMFIGGIRALLLQSLHPVAMLGVSEHSGFRSDPWGRLQRTSRFLATTTYGNDSRRRAEHRDRPGRPRSGTAGRRPAACPIEPTIPICWAGSTLPRSTASWPATRPSARPADATRPTATSASPAGSPRSSGVLDPPQTVAELEDCLEQFRPELQISPAAQEAAHLLLRDPPLSGPARFAYRVLAAGAVSILPGWARADCCSLPTLPGHRPAGRPTPLSPDRPWGTSGWALEPAAPAWASSRVAAGRARVGDYGVRFSAGIGFHSLDGRLVHWPGGGRPASRDQCPVASPARG